MTDERDIFSPAHATPAEDAPVEFPTGQAGAIGAHAAPAENSAEEADFAPELTFDPASGIDPLVDSPVDFLSEQPAAIGAHAAPVEPNDLEEHEPKTTPLPEPFPELPLEPDLYADPLDPLDLQNQPQPEPLSTERPEYQPEHRADDQSAQQPESEPEPTVPADAVPDPEAPVSPGDTAEIDVETIEAKLNDPGSTMSFEPISDERIDTDSTFDAGTTTSLMWGARSDVGCVRSHNEDSYLVQSPLFCVCDGMGGHAAGEVASSIAVETISKMAPKAADPAILGAAIEAANAAIIEAAQNGLGKPGMGCTATAAYIEGTSLAIAHVGDSRAYLLHEGTLIRVTRDHSYVEELVEAGEITADEARVHPNRSVITRALGNDPLMYADHFQLNIEEGDRLILCSDGLSSMISDGDIEQIATQSSTAQICTDNLVDAALAAGGADNVTVVVADVVNDGHLQQAAAKRRRIAAAIAIAVLATLIIGGAITFFSITRSVFLGVKDDAVAVYTGIPSTPLGLKLRWLEDETSVQLEDLPEDTQSRLRAGIPQDSIETANRTVDNYRRQIQEAQQQQLQNSEALKKDASKDAAGEKDPADSVAKSAPANSVAPSGPNDSNPTGGDAR